MSSTFVIFYYFPTARRPASSYVGAFRLAEDVIAFLSACYKRDYSSMNIADIPVGESFLFRDFAPMEFKVFHLAVNPQAKHLYISETMPPLAATSKISKITETLQIRVCPVCGSRGVAVDDDGHCSYACLAKKVEQGQNHAHPTVRQTCPRVTLP
jgi:hypothetical protein